MPTDGHASVLVEIHVASIGPILLVGEAAHRHRDLHQVLHPRRVELGRHLQAAVLVVAVAALLDHPSRLPRHRAVRAHGLHPLGAVLDLAEPPRALVLVEGPLQVACIGPPRFVLQEVVPSFGGGSHIADEHQTGLRPVLLPRVAAELFGCLVLLFALALALLAFAVLSLALALAVSALALALTFSLAAVVLMLGDEVLLGFGIPTFLLGLPSAFALPRSLLLLPRLLLVLLLLLLLRFRPLRRLLRLRPLRRLLLQQRLQHRLQQLLLWPPFLGARLGRPLLFLLCAPRLLVQRLVPPSLLVAAILLGPNRLVGGLQLPRGRRL
mmetsp:Transcript_8080/g.21434  ORF Transcript_8080/g.21434 Transcript_8080/m.21434 type:complete len:325 (-) Transcript_8080:123-1097(-)